MPAGFLDHPKPIAFAHRGGAAHFPENSWRAFEHAVGLGYAYLETDAHATADGVLVAFHDKTLDRVTDRSGAIASLPAHEVTAARIAGTDPVPLLEDLIGAWPDVRFNIDVKDWPAARPVAELVRRTASWDRVCITSFSARRLCATRKYLDRPVCMSASPVGAGAIRLWMPPHLLGPAFASRWVRCAQIPVSLANAPVLARARAAGLDVHAWTVNDEAVMKSLLDLGVDGIMTDNAELLREVMITRGQWHPRSLPPDRRPRVKGWTAWLAGILYPSLPLKPTNAKRPGGNRQMAERALRGTRLGATSYENDRNTDLAPRQEVTFDCEKGHRFSVPFSAEAEIPAKWECRICGAPAITASGDQPAAAKIKPPRSHWDMLMERRSVADLEEVLAERLAIIRSGRAEPAAPAAGRTRQRKSA